MEHAIRTACQIIGRPDVIVVSSQSVLGTFSEDQLPAGATMSSEIGILPLSDDNAETTRLADLIEGVAGEFLSFDQLHGFSIDDVNLDTAILPGGWRGRLVRVLRGPADNWRDDGVCAYCDDQFMHGPTDPYPDVLEAVVLARIAGNTSEASRLFEAIPFEPPSCIDHGGW